MLSKSSKLPIGYIEIRILAHATEETEKVLAAVRNLLPEPIARDTVFRETAVAGHHGNPIILFEAKLEDRQTLPPILKHIGSKLTALDKETLSDELKLHLEKGNLYLRFDKQQAFLGASRLSSYDPIHFKIHFKNRTSDQIIDICKESGLLP